MHRDFKPANLILGADGRVRVLDFGLARTAQTGIDSGENDASEALASLADDASTWGGGLREQTKDERPPTKEEQAAPVALGEASKDAAKSPAPSTPSSPSSPSDSGRDVLSSSERRLLETPLTQVGSIVGTPPYMAPEQHLGGVSDARTDQFSFCVAFYQALYGERPSTATTTPSCRPTSSRARSSRRRRGSAVPAWLRAVVLRGLSVAPDAASPRWTRSWRRWATIRRCAAVAGPARRDRLLVGIAGVASWRSLHGPAACGGAEAQLDGVWDGARKQAVQAAFDKTGKPFAADAFAVGDGARSTATRSAG